MITRQQNNLLVENKRGTGNCAVVSKKRWTVVLLCSVSSSTLTERAVLQARAAAHHHVTAFLVHRALVMRVLFHQQEVDMRRTWVSSGRCRCPCQHCARTLESTMLSAPEHKFQKHNLVPTKWPCVARHHSDRTHIVPPTRPPQRSGASLTHHQTGAHANTTDPRNAQSPYHTPDEMFEQVVNNTGKMMYECPYATNTRLAHVQCAGTPLAVRSEQITTPNQQANEGRARCITTHDGTSETTSTCRENPDARHDTKKQVIHRRRPQKTTKNKQTDSFRVPELRVGHTKLVTTETMEEQSFTEVPTTAKQQVRRTTRDIKREEPSDSTHAIHVSPMTCLQNSRIDEHLIHVNDKPST